MNRRMIFQLLCYILRIEALCLLPAAAVSLIYREFYPALIMVLCAAGIAAISLLGYAFRPKTRQIGAQEGFVSVALCWIFVSAFGAMPFYISGAIPHYVDALFETVSGFTTTGASILSDVEAMPKGLLYWRSFTHWLGGMGVLVFLLAVVSMGKGRNSLLHVMRAESPGPQVDKLVPRLQNSAKILYSIYVVMTVAQVVFLLLGGMPLFDSICTAFGTAGTGGFGVKNDSMASYSPYLQNVCTIFMALFGVNFSIYYLFLLKQFTKAFKNQEFLAYFGIMGAAVAIISFNIRPLFNSIWDAIHHAAFTVSSIMTTTGFATVDFNLWPPLSKILLILLMIIGACAGSTGGGIKVARLLLIVKGTRRSIKRMLRPRSVVTVQMDGSKVEDDVMWNTFSYLTVYVIMASISILIVSIDGNDIETNISAVMACLNNIGPGLGAVGPTANYGHFSDLSKLTLTFNMLAGRLEIFPLLMLFIPSAWRRG